MVLNAQGVSTRLSPLNTRCDDVNKAHAQQKRCPNHMQSFQNFVLCQAVGTNGGNFIHHIIVPRTYLIDHTQLYTQMNLTLKFGFV